MLANNFGSKNILLVVLFGCFCLLNAGRGLVRGRLLLFWRSVKHSDSPSLFWLAVGLSAGVGVLLLVLSFV